MNIELTTSLSLLRGLNNKSELQDIKYQEFGFYVLPVYNGTLHTLHYKNLEIGFELTKYVKGGLIDRNIRTSLEIWLNQVIPKIIDEFEVNFVIINNVIVIETFKVIRVDKEINYDSLYLMCVLKEYVDTIFRYENEILTKRDTVKIVFLFGISLSLPKEIALQVDFLKNKLTQYSYATSCIKCKLIPFIKTSHEGISGIDLSNNYLIIKI